MKDRKERIARLLAEAADPVIEQVLRRTQVRSGFQPEDVDDLRSLIHVKLLERLGGPEEQAPIHSFRDFVAVTAYNAVDDLLRKRYPERTRLKRRLRRLLATDPRFAIASDGRSTAVGLAGADLATTEPPALPRVTNAMRDAAHPAEALHEVLAALGKPVELDDLATLMAELWNVQARPRSDAELPDTLQSGAQDAAERVETRQSLALLWQEIRALPADQRVALLLNLRDGQGESAISLFVFTGIAGVEDLAAASGLTHAELDALWSELPLEDARIARILGVTRQQVINLRKSARMRLARRKMRGGF